MRNGVKDRPSSHAAVPGSTAAVLEKVFGRASESRTSGTVYLDSVIHERTRLAILTALHALGDPGCSFLDLRDTLSLTDGNLMAHLRTLEEAGLIERTKEGAGRNSNTTVHLSPIGKKAFKNYLDRLEMLVRAVRGK